MHLLMTGGGSSGSWKIRGEQLGRAIGATLVPRAVDVAAFDAAIVVKRAPDELLERLRHAEVPIIWDVVDAWPQPDGNGWDVISAQQWLTKAIERVRPRAVVAATKRMRDDVIARTGLPCLWLPHHGRPGMAPNPIRPRVRAVGYEGGNYLGGWERRLRKACDRRGWQFVLNPPALADLDIVVALREARGYPARAWKSNVKLANAQASGTPVILQEDHGYVETAAGAEVWIESGEQLDAALDALEPEAVRRHASAELQRAAPRLDDVARAYRQWLSKLSF